MCSVNDGTNFFRPMSQKDLPVISQHYNFLTLRFIRELFDAMTDHNTVRPAVLLVILEGIRRLQMVLWGNSSFGATFAYSALQMEPGAPGGLFHRYQDPIMAHVHDAMLQFALAERNMKLVQKVLTSHGYNLHHFCDCGCGITQEGEGYMETSEYLAVNYVRSYGESVGAPVHALASIDDLPLSLTDMHKHEVDGYKRIWQILQTLPKHDFEGDQQLSLAFTHLKNMKGKPDATSRCGHGENAVGATSETASPA